ncbi:YjjG family noncanonical pyrimidine nucleotidase [Fibrella forsythiae]|uniref:YjjG family noncanonical pyrimidine nucleotidase n=1 Tax=Fibrella forsythiae TaxID=2817061 RepID=A0ABS3JHG6_9BACT|nr:YjjG family noncanonical pyrimidine nucleotidase [Fibrella forsythiae]MBO0948853.1 YjjG family noncanonical pyrimidine nucleotidase [Fibrella forsythiae]
MYKHLFFDLDHTLWDFDRNSSESIAEIYDTYRLAEVGLSSVDAFAETFITVNRQLWRDYDLDLIGHEYIRANRFPMVFRALGVGDTSCCADLNTEYLRLLPQKAHLTDSARDVLEHLHGRYRMHIITNGFAEIQAVKMAASEIAHFFEEVVTTQSADAKKPNPRIFEYALQATGATVAESLMLGDNYEADILGAKAVGLDTVFYNPKGQQVDEPATYDIRHWNELMGIL